MNFSIPVGFLVGAIVMAIAAIEGVRNPLIFLNLPAAMIVIGGTVSAAFICLPFGYFISLWKVFRTTVSGQRRDETFGAIREIIRISVIANQDQPLGPEIEATKNHFLRECLKVLEESGLTHSELDEVLQKRVESQYEKYQRDSSTFRTIGKFPPAFGLIGTSIGMIGLLQGLGEGNAYEQIGPAMSISLVATLYGLIFANGVLIPLGENLAQASEEDLIMRRIVADGVRLIREKKHPLFVREHLISYLAPAERNQLEKAL